MPRKEKITVDVSDKTPDRKPTWLELRMQNNKIIKLNEELTAENTKFVTDIEGWIAEKIKHENEANRLRVENERLLKRLDTVNNLEKRIERQAEYYLEIVSHKDKVLGELTSIKSKWWYKLMTWGW